MKKYLPTILFILYFPLITLAHGGGHGCTGHSGSCHGGYVIYSHNSNEKELHYLPHNGMVWLESGTVLRGTFKYDWWELPTYNFIYYADSTTRIGKIAWKKVNKIVLAGADSSLSYRYDSTEFYQLTNCKGFYRKLTKGKIEVYDGMADVTEIPGAVSNNDIVVKYNGSQTRFHDIDKFNQYIAGIIPDYTSQKKDGQINLQLLFSTINQYNNQGN